MEQIKYKGITLALSTKSSVNPYKDTVFTENLKDQLHTAIFITLYWLVMLYSVPLLIRQNPVVFLYNNYFPAKIF